MTSGKVLAEKALSNLLIKIAAEYRVETLMVSQILELYQLPYQLQ